MTSPSTSDDGSPIVLIPIKAFRSAKGRLEASLSPRDRADLARRLAAGVIAAAAPWPVVVVCDDDEVATFAAAHGCTVVRVPARGLNAAVRDAIDEMDLDGRSHVVVVHGDLALPRSLHELSLDREVVVVPDRRRSGTNVLALSPSIARRFTFAYGPASFDAHLAEAIRLGVPATVVDDHALGLDVDEPDDLDEVRRVGILPS